MAKTLRDPPFNETASTDLETDRPNQQKPRIDCAGIAEINTECWKYIIIFVCST